jgi:flagellar hook protein FlgE
MSLFGTLQTGASGLGVSGASLGVIGDNIANLNTTGYKRNRATFADMLPQDVFGLGGPSQLGRGAARMTIGGQFTQGSLMGTGNALDVAITGQGWFQVSNGAEDFYTRDGSFGVNVDGYLVNSLGLAVQGYSAIDGQLSPVIGDIQISDAPVPPSETETITLDMVLDPNGTNTEDYSLLVLDGASVSIEDAANAADFSTSLTVYDSLGQPHEVVVNFEKDPANPDTWTYSMVIDGGEAGVGIDGLALEIGSGTMTFDTDGNLVSNTFVATGPAWNWEGADPWFPTVELGLDAAGNATDGSISQNANANAVVGVSQDGYAMGDLSSVAVDEDGVIRGQYTNGQELILGQLAIATFEAESGLDRVGGNLFRATSVSGDAAMGAAGTGGRGGVAGYALERSNVDLEAEFVDMIQAQRSYQANAGVIRAADETLQELVNLV